MAILARANDETVDDEQNKQPTWLVVGLGAAGLLGAVIGLTAFPNAWPAITIMTLAQLAITVAGFHAPRRPVIWSAAVGAGCLGSTLTHPVLSELAYSGGTPWIGLATMAAALTLYRTARDWTAFATGSAALVLGSTGLVAVSIKAGIPAAPAIMATSVYLLLGVVAALSLHLRDARSDRVRRPELSVEIDHTGDEGASAHGAVERARRALAIVALRSDELVSATTDVSARRTAADLRDLARRGLSAPGESDQSTTRIEIRPATPNAASTNRTTTPMPNLPDREREILRLVSTGASNATIARSLYLSEATVKQYVTKLMRKFDRENRTQLALMAVHWFDEF